MDRQQNDRLGGGRDADGEWLGSGAIYDPTGDTWTTINLTNAPLPTITISATSGDDSGDTYAGLGDITPPTISLPSIDEEEARAKINASANEAMKKAIGFYVTELVTPWSNAVWVPSVSKMFLIGGLSLGLGAAYDPATDTWTAIGAPESLSWAPFSPPAVWTGKRIFTWDKRQGAIYDPAEGKWSLASTTDQPKERYHHTLVMAGDQAIVWGGMASSAGRRKGAFYYPLTDTWEETQTENAPIGRYFHTSVWTGEAMIVWGGIPLTDGDDSILSWVANPLSYNTDKQFRGAVYWLIDQDSGSRPADPPPERKVSCPLGSRDNGSGICIGIGEVLP